MAGKSKFIIVITGLVFVSAFWIYWVSVNPTGTESTMVQYLSIEKLMENQTRDKIKLGGIVEAGSIEINQSDLLESKFILEQGGARLPVRYYGTRPDLFKDGAEVIVEGRMEDNIFQAENLQTKCASRYEGDLRNTEVQETEAS